jgi:hypothetical protein
MVKSSAIRISSTLFEIKNISDVQIMYKAYTSSLPAWSVKEIVKSQHKRSEVTSRYYRSQRSQLFSYSQRHLIVLVLGAARDTNRWLQTNHKGKVKLSLCLIN